MNTRTSDIRLAAGETHDPISLELLKPSAIQIGPYRYNPETLRLL
jgi:hypothetical protein